MIINFDRKDRANDEEAMIEKVDLNRLSSTLRFRSILRVLIKIKQWISWLEHTLEILMMMMMTNNAWMWPQSFDLSPFSKVWLWLSRDSIEFRRMVFSKFQQGISILCTWYVWINIGYWLKCNVHWYKVYPLRSLISPWIVFKPRSPRSICGPNENIFCSINEKTSWETLGEDLKVRVHLFLEKNLHTGNTGNCTRSKFIGPSSKKGKCFWNPVLNKEVGFCTGIKFDVIELVPPRRN